MLGKETGTKRKKYLHNNFVIKDSCVSVQVRLYDNWVSKLRLHFIAIFVFLH